MWKKNNILLPKNSESNNIAIVFWYALDVASTMLKAGVRDEELVRLAEF